MHSDEPKDVSTILCALFPNCIQVQAHSPVDLDVLQSDGSEIRKDLTSIPGASYQSYHDTPTHELTAVTVPVPMPGMLTIKATAKPGALPTDTYSISVTQNGVTSWIAQDVPVAEIPSAGYSVVPNSAPIPSISGPTTVEATGPSGAVVSLTGSGTDPDGDAFSLRWYSALGDTDGPTFSGQIPLGFSQVVLVATDSKGATGTTDTLVKVQDTTPPVISNTPAKIALPATGRNGAAATWVIPTAIDLVSGVVAVACDHQSGSTFPLGRTLVTCSASDAAGNTTKATFTVFVYWDKDDEPCHDSPGHIRSGDKEDEQSRRDHRKCHDSQGNKPRGG
jgi:hypothetical protein